MGYVRTARAVAPQMKARGWGRIVNISGLAARQSGNAVGSIRNVAVAALTKNLADELGPSGINVTVVHPGQTRTERTAAMVAAQAKAQGVRGSDPAAHGRGQLDPPRRRRRRGRRRGRLPRLAASIAINGDAIAVGGGVPRAIHY
jgi:NAD(P)-dependent dehydrogenase (short-subunit alcohol dehydrogenase family)